MNICTTLSNMSDFRFCFNFDFCINNFWIFFLRDNHYRKIVISIFNLFKVAFGSSGLDVGTFWKKLKYRESIHLNFWIDLLFSFDCLGSSLTNIDPLATFFNFLGRVLMSSRIEGSELSSMGWTWTSISMSWGKGLEM